MNPSLYDIFLYNNPPLSVKSSEVPKEIEIPRDLFLVDHRSFIGVEVEVERVPYYDYMNLAMTKQPYGWAVKEDGSLRNQGLEFVSQPLRGDALLKALVSLNQFLTTHFPKHEFSKRTSVHIHLNVRRLSVEKLFSLIFLYQVFESSIFRFLDSSCKMQRSGNIFCAEVNHTRNYVPIARAYEFFVKGEFARAAATLSEWRKYSAMNVAPIATLGTLEFRHMHGNIDVKTIVNWINILQSLKLAAIKIPLEQILKQIEEINTTSRYKMFMDHVFGPLSNLLDAGSLWPEMEAGAYAAKEIIYNVTRVKKVLQTDENRFFNSSLWKYMETIGYRKAPLSAELDELIKRRDKLRTELYNMTDSEKIRKAKATLKEIDNMIEANY